MTMDRLMSQSLGYVSGRWYDNGLGVATDRMTTDSRAGGDLFGVPVCFSCSVVLDRIAVETTQSTLGADVRMAIYDNAASAPRSLVYDAGPVSMAVAGVCEAPLGSLRLSMGWYWLVFAHDFVGTRVFTAYNWLEGMADLGFDSANQPRKCMFVSAPTASPAMPAEYPVGSMSYEMDRPPRVLVRHE